MVGSVHPASHTQDQSTKDFDGDAIMPGINALLAMLSKNNDSAKVGAPLGGENQLQDNSSKNNRHRAL